MQVVMPGLILKIVFFGAHDLLGANAKLVAISGGETDENKNL